ncbi:hypothetical protein EBZ38_01820 [bacterium]|nr:hypothetical protein [bacterium]NDD83008.1 hypothetical protein [bacterium]
MDILSNAVKTGQAKCKGETYGITVVYTYDTRYNCLLILWYSDNEGEFVLDDLGRGKLTKSGRDFVEELYSRESHSHFDC